MDLKEIQQALARLYTDATLRERFQRDPDQAAQEEGWEQSTVAYLARVSACRMGQFARQLKGKRLGEVRDLLPRTAEALGGRFTDLFLVYADTSVLSGVHKHRDDARDFAVWALRHPAECPLSPCERDLLRYESIWLQAGPGAFHFRVARFLHPVHSLPIRSAGLATAETTRRPTLVIWLRTSTKYHCLALPWL